MLNFLFLPPFPFAADVFTEWNRQREADDNGNGGGRVRE